MARNRKPTAYPEIIRPGDWQVEEWRPDGTGTPPCTDVAGHRMWVPAGNSKFAREVRFHENLHVAKSPANGCPAIEGVSMPSLLAAEDCRVNLWGTTVREHDALGASPMPDAFTLATNKSQRGMAQLVAACLGYTSADQWCETMRHQLYKLARNDDLPEWLQEHCSALRETIYTVRYQAPDFCLRCGTYEDTEFEDAISLARWLDEFPDGAPGPSKKPGGQGDGDYSDKPGDGGNKDEALWGTMKVETPPLTIKHANKVGRRVTPSIAGQRLRNISRLYTDGAIFDRRRKSAPPDAVLIDQSGSMSWNASKLHELVAKMPVGIVAGYSGGDGVGILRVLAKDGKMVAPRLVSPPYGGNEVDGPALRWLAAQKGRKVWVSDQGVCSDACDDEDALLADCNEVRRKANIRVCLSTDPTEIMRVLRR